MEAGAGLDRASKAGAAERNNRSGLQGMLASFATSSKRQSSWSQDENQAPSSFGTYLYRHSKSAHDDDETTQKCQTANNKTLTEKTAEKTCDTAAEASPWTREEKVSFQSLVEVYGKQWETISTFMPTHRTPKQLENYYVSDAYQNTTFDDGETSVVPNKTDGWTAEEKDAFRRAFSTLGKEWEEISTLIPGRSPECCETYFYTSYKEDKKKMTMMKKKKIQHHNTLTVSIAPNESSTTCAKIKKHPMEEEAVTPKAAEATTLSSSEKRKCEPWMEEERQAFHTAFCQHGPQWGKFNAFLPQRSPKACYAYYHRCYKNDNESSTPANSNKQPMEDAVTAEAAEATTLSTNKRKCQPWMEEERQAFHTAFCQHGPQWGKFNAFLPQRSPKACYAYYHRCYKNDNESSTPANSNKHPMEDAVTAEAAEATTLSTNKRKCEPWMEEERQAFHTAFRQHGPQWDKFTQFLPQRNPKACSIYYYRYYKNGNESSTPAKIKKIPMEDAVTAEVSLSGKRKCEPWMEEDKQAFRSAFLQYGTQWDKFSKFLPQRSPTACYTYYRRHYKNGNKATVCDYRPASARDNADAEILATLEEEEEEGRLKADEGRCLFKKPRIQAIDAAAAAAAAAAPSTHADLDRLLRDETRLFERLYNHSDSETIKTIVQKIGFCQVTQRTLLAISSKLIQTGIPFIDKLSVKERYDLELWIRRTSCVDGDLFPTQGRRPRLSISEKEIILILSDHYSGEPVFLRHGGKMYFLAQSSSHTQPPSYNLEELRVQLRSNRDKFHLKMDCIADSSKRLALQLWISSSPEPLPAFFMLT